MDHFHVLFIFAILLAELVWSHPGHPASEEAARRAMFLTKNRRGIDDYRVKCNSQTALEARIARRSAAARSATQSLKRTIQSRIIPKGYSNTQKDSRDLKDILETQHEFVHDFEQEALLFADYSSYMLQSETTPGPYYIDGELIRSHITEGQEGIPLFLDIQFIDASTCEPIQDMYIDVWQCNATGVYSGVKSMDNGNFGDDDNVNESFLRGIQPTDANGVVQFSTIFPGHYIGRTTHIHLLAHDIESTDIRTNGTLAGTNNPNHGAQVSHVGQLFFDASLIHQVESHYPYMSNMQPSILNAEDAVLIEESGTSDPLVQYMFLGDELQDGIFAWITIGIDPTVSYYVEGAATWYGSFGRQWKKLWWR